MAAPTLQTLDRGLAALKLVADAPGGLRPIELAAALGVDKAIAYRLLATLAAHGLVRRLPSGRHVTGAALPALAGRAEGQRLAAAGPHLARLSAETRASACLALAVGEEAVVAAIHEGGDGILRVTYRIGVRHPLTRGATGIAMLAGRPPATGEPPAVARARIDGHAITRGELQPGAVGVAAPVLTPDMPRDAGEAAVAVVTFDDLPPGAPEAVMRCAAALRPLWG